ncbi:alpha/beta hydrolase [Litoribacillus peritrichatus]|uniref:Alpha/beta hydrolase n=1 Tax=Litoribacillus peritrichatus TaxID=718191 RepID=A0ABP7N3V7_9GAMM
MKLQKLKLLQTAIASLGIIFSLSTQANTPSHLSNVNNEEFETQPWSLGQIEFNNHFVKKVSFTSKGSQIIGNLFLPKNAIKGSIVIIGPVAYVKEQAPIQYASRLVKEGYSVLIFDPRYHGESEGEPRRFESRKAKIEDLQAATEFMSGLNSLNNQPIYGLGICQGANWIIEAASIDPRITKVATTAGHYLTPQVASMYLGGEEKVQARLTEASEARDLFLQTGKVEYQPIIRTDLVSKSEKVLLGAPVIKEFYNRWEDKGSFWNFHGLWENRITTMSEVDIWGHDIRPVAAKLTKPLLMIHADNAASGPEVPKEIFKLIPSAQKDLVWLESRNQMQFYEDPLTIDLVTEHLIKFFN